jgi:UDP-N-acetylglucosamine 2-epimerase
VQAGANRLVEAETETILNAVIKMMDKCIEMVDNPFGDGQAGRKIAGFIKEHYL